MSKILTLIVVALLCGSVLFGANADRITMNRNTAQLSASLLISELRGSYAKRAANSETIYQDMLKSPSAYINSATALSTLSAEYATGLKADYAKDAQTLLDSIRERYHGDDEFFPTEFVLDALVLPDQYVQENQRNIFPAAFTLARDKAATEQRVHIVGSVYPTEAQVDSLSEEELVKILQEEMLNSWENVIFDENRGFVQESIVTPIVKEAVAQKSEQLKLLSSASTSESLTPQGYVTELNKLLEDYIQGKRASLSSRKTYDVFPSVSTQVEVRAKELAVSKFITTLSSFVPEWSDEYLVEEMLKSPMLHRSTSGSQTVFSDAYKRAIMSSAARSYLRRVPEAERNDLRIFLEPNAINSESGNRQVEPLFTANIEPRLKKLRQLVGEAQLKTYFKTLDDKSWTPPENMVAEYAITKRKDIGAEWRGMKGLEVQQVNEAVLFDETLKSVVERVTEAFDLAARAYRRQSKHSGDVRSSVSKIFENAQSTGSLEHTVALHNFLAIPEETILSESVVAEAWKTMVLERWNKERVSYLWPIVNSRPVASGIMYNTLFKEISEDIDKQARMLMSELRNLLPEEYGAGKNNPNLKVINCNIDVELNAGGYVVQVFSPQNQLLNQTFNLPVASYGVADEFLLHQLQTESVDFLEKLILSAPTGEENLVQVYIRVKNGQIPYGFVKELSDSVRIGLRKIQFKVPTRFRVVDELKKEY